MTYTTVPIPKQFTLEFVNEKGQKRKFYLFPNGLFICPNCQLTQWMAQNKDKLMIGEVHDPKCKYYE